jgi:hypothetical protein
MRYGDSGEEVVQIQEALLARGYALPKYGADGHLGDETWNALRTFARDQRLRWTPPVPAEVIVALEAVPPVAHVVDLTSQQTNPPAAKEKFKLDSKGKVVVRDPKTITGIVLHQTACWFGVSTQQVAAAGGDRELALHLRALNIATHLTAFDGRGANLDCGHAIYASPLPWYAYHANGANSVSLGVECEGVYPGLVSQGGETPSPRLVEASRAAVKFALEEGSRLGMPIEFIWAHWQSSATRRADPGEALWRAVVLDYAIPVLGLRTETARVWGDGRPIPVEWDPNGVGPY